MERFQATHGGGVRSRPWRPGSGGLAGRRNLGYNSASATGEPSMSVYFTSDTHFGHARIIESCARPFASVAEMDEAMIARWNARVQTDDTVYHLGDFAFRADYPASHYIMRLNGSIHLIRGNHDGETLKQSAYRFASVQDILEVRLGAQWIILCHYPMREWHRAWDGAWHLFGHVHSRLNHAPHGFSLDVGVDSHDFRPWSVEEIADVMAARTNPFTGSRRSREAVPAGLPAGDSAP
jgi:calcineurin-like phosphoesterase family protein